MFVPPLTVRTANLIAAATFDADLLTGPMQNMDMEELVAAATEGNVYVNFHTVRYPAGVMRGQLNQFPCINNGYEALMSQAV